MFGNEANNSRAFTIHQASTSPMHCLMDSSQEPPILYERWWKFNEPRYSAHGHLPVGRWASIQTLLIVTLRSILSTTLELFAYRAADSWTQPPSRPSTLPTLLHRLSGCLQLYPFYSCSSPFLNWSRLLHWIACMLSCPLEALPSVHISVTKFCFTLITPCHIHWSVRS